MTATLLGLQRASDKHLDLSTFQLKKIFNLCWVCAVVCVYECALCACMVHV